LLRSEHSEVRTLANQVAKRAKNACAELAACVQEASQAKK